MKTIKIVKIEAITASKAPSGKPLVVIFLENSDYELYRSPKQFIAGVNNNFDVEDYYDSNSDTFTQRFEDLINGLRGGEVVGNIRLVRAGDTYKLTAKHQDVKAGKAEVGEVRRYNQDGLHVEGFIRVYPISQMMLNAVAYAKAVIELESGVLFKKRTVTLDDDDDEESHETM